MGLWPSQTDMRTRPLHFISEQQVLVILSAFFLAYSFFMPRKIPTSMLSLTSGSEKHKNHSWMWIDRTLSQGWEDLDFNGRSECPCRSYFTEVHFHFLNSKSLYIKWTASKLSSNLHDNLVSHPKPATSLLPRTSIPVCIYIISNIRLERLEQRLSG